MCIRDSINAEYGAVADQTMVSVSGLLPGLVAVVVAYLTLLLVMDQEISDSHFNDQPKHWPLPGLRFKSLALQDLQLNFVEAGPEDATKCMIMLHGFPESASAWGEYISHYALAGWHVVAPDQRHVNQSVQVDGTAPTLELLAQDTAALITQTSPCSKAVVIGHDWGAGAAWATALQHPDLVEALVVFNVPHLEVYRWHNLAGMPFALKEAWYFLMFGLTRPLAYWKCVKNDYSWFIWFTFGSSEPGTYSKAEIQAYKDMYDTSLWNALSWYQMGNDWLMKGLLPWSDSLMGSIWKDGNTPSTVPTLQLYGSKDMYIAPGMAHKSLSHEYVSHPKKKMVMFDAGHWLPKERPQECMAEIDAFLSSPWP
eukprot:TRINITY_DN10883_c0_g1_i14.p1 TRINITY_DN10883_c0_g1~~TRINITY_DN10883_c0_g1_i14.p1  ORF type:complete len:368 (-),score=93.21 TRINITY_DN10883_c0_g1_i14:410-1513(-)